MLRTWESRVDNVSPEPDVLAERDADIGREPTACHNGLCKKVNRHVMLVKEA